MNKFAKYTHPDDKDYPGIWLSQTTWFIDASTGDDTNDGLTSGTALASAKELSRRLFNGVTTLPFGLYTITIIGDLATGDFIDVDAIESTATGASRIVFQSQPVVAQSGALTAGSAPIVSGVSRELVEDTVNGLTGFDLATTFSGNQVMTMTSGAASAYSTFLAKDLGANLNEAGVFTAGSQFAYASPSVGDTYDIETLPKVQISRVSVSRAKSVFRPFYPLVQFTKLHLETAGTDFSQWTSLNSEILFDRCSLFGVFHNSGTVTMIGCSLSPNSLFKGGTWRVYAGVHIGGLFFNCSLTYGLEATWQTYAVPFDSGEAAFDNELAFRGVVARIVDPISVFDAQGNVAIPGTRHVVQVPEGCTVIASETLWGNGAVVAATAGAAIRVDGEYFYASGKAPTVVSNFSTPYDTVIGGVVVPYTALPFANSTGGILAERAL